MNVQDDTFLAPAAVLAAKPFWADEIALDIEPDGPIGISYRADRGCIHVGLGAFFDGQTVDFMDGHMPEVWLPDHSDTMTAQELHDLAIDAVTVENIMRTIGGDTMTNVDASGARGMSRGRVYTTRTAAEYCGIAESTLRNRLCLGAFPSPHKNGRKNAWFQNELDAWLAANVDGY